MIFSVLSDSSENENITLIIVVVMISMILRKNYYYCISLDACIQLHAYVAYICLHMLVAYIIQTVPVC